MLDGEILIFLSDKTFIFSLIIDLNILDLFLSVRHSKMFITS
jgi:hypothetical protein